MQLRCPRRPILEDPGFFSDLFWMYQNYKNGLLPEEGGLLSQSHKLMAAFRELDLQVSLCQEEKDRKKKRR